MFRPRAEYLIFSITDIQLDKREYRHGKSIGAVFCIHWDHPFSHSQVIGELSEWEGLHFIEKLQ